MGRQQSGLALLADDLYAGVVFVGLRIDATRFADGQLCNLLDALFSVSFHCLGGHLDVDEDGVSLGCGMLLVVSFLAISAEANIAVHTQAETLLVFLTKRRRS